jgi:hypothetical protein
MFREEWGRIGKAQVLSVVEVVCQADQLEQCTEMSSCYEIKNSTYHRQYTIHNKHGISVLTHTYERRAHTCPWKCAENSVGELLKAYKLDVKSTLDTNAYIAFIRHHLKIQRGMLCPFTREQLHILYFLLHKQLTLGTFHYLLTGISDTFIKNKTFPLWLVKVVYLRANDYWTRFKMSLGQKPLCWLDSTGNRDQN